MTLIVGIKCKEGVVMAADRAVTFSIVRGVNTISHSAPKLVVLKSGMIIGGTGHVGAKQRFVETVERTWEKVAGQKKSALDIARSLSGDAIHDFGTTKMPMGEFAALVAFPSTKGGPQLCEFQAKDFQPELKDSGIWFVSVGSGQMIADSYLAFMRDVFWRNGMPTIEHGMFAAAWVMRQSIRASPGGIAEPIDIALLQGDKAKLLDENELKYQLDAADQATLHFGKFDPKNLPVSATGTDVEAPAPPMPEPPK